MLEEMRCPAGMNPPATDSSPGVGGSSRTEPFASAVCLGHDWRTVADTLGDRLAGAEGRLGILCTAEPEGGKVLFCRRDRESAVEDTRRMTADLKRRVGNRPIRGGLYVSCAARGPNQFASPERETQLIRDTLDEFPMVGFLANGELNRDRIYVYTGHRSALGILPPCRHALPSP